MRLADCSVNEYQQQATAIRFEDWEFAYSTVLGTAEAIEYCLQHQDNPAALALLRQAMKDPYYELRNMTMNMLAMDSAAVRTAVTIAIIA